MAFSNPYWLWGLSTLSIPIAIHLLSRKEGKVISVGSLRYLKDANTQQFKSLRLNEIVLLLIRCFMFSLVILFMSGLQITHNPDLKWVLLEERLRDDSKATSISDSLINHGYELHYVTSQLAVEGNISSSASYWALAEQLKKAGITDVVIVSASRAEDFKGVRAEQPVSVQWISLPIPDQQYLIAASRTDKNNISIKSGIAENENSHFITSNATISSDQKVYKTETDSISIIPRDTVKVVIASDPVFSFDKQILLASLKAIQSTVSEQIIIEELRTNTDQNDSAEVLIWLSEEPLPSTKANTIIYYKGNLSSSPFYQESYSTWQLTKHINEDVALNDDFSIQLSKIILSNKAQWEIANKKDQRVFPEKMMWAKSVDGGDATGTQKTGYEPLNKHLIALLLITLLAERLIAYRRNQ